MPYPSLNEVSEFCSGLGKNWKIESTIHDEDLEYLFSKNNRSVRLKWLARSPEEFWFSMHDGTRCDLVDWTEMFENEDLNDFFKYIEKVTKRYLENETKVVKRWRVFGKETLKYFENGQWHDLRSPI